MKFNYAVLGAGRQGVSAAYDLGRFGDAENIFLYDKDFVTADKATSKLNHLLPNKRFIAQVLDVENQKELIHLLTNIDSTISAVPYCYNYQISQAAIEAKTNLCDLGGHTETVQQQMQLHESAKQAGITLVPDCGMGPGLNISLGVYALSFIEEPEDLFIWDGGLPKNPEPPWNYQLTFNINGLTNEYYGDAIFIRDGKVTAVPTLTEMEFLNFPNPLGQLEAAVTSGGLSTAPWTFTGKLQRLENKTLRYPGHWKQFEAYKRLGMFAEKQVLVGDQLVSPRELFHTLLEPKIQAEIIDDIAVIRTQCKGWSNGQRTSTTLELIENKDNKSGFTAMEKLTGWHAAMICILSAKSQLPKGALPVEKALDKNNLPQEMQKRGWKLSICHEI